MKLIIPSVKILEQSSGLNGIYEQIELAGRTCYKSEPKYNYFYTEKNPYNNGTITIQIDERFDGEKAIEHAEKEYLKGNKDYTRSSTTAKDFVDRMIKSQHCYTGNNEILTNKGWIKFKDYNNEKVAVINQDCSFKGFEYPQRIIKHQYDGNFYYYPSLGIEVTDGHRMFGIFRESKNDFYNNSNYNVFKCNEYYKDNNGREKTLGERMFKSPKHCKKINTTNPYGELIGFWLGDGCHSPEIKNKLVFHLKKERKIEYLKRLSEELGYKFEKRKSDYYTITNNNIGSSFNSLYYNNGKKISLNYFPSVEIGHSIMQGLINSDGSLGINTKTITFTNTSKSIIDWMLLYAPLCGYTISDLGVSYETSTHNLVYKILLLNTNYTINNDSRNRDSKVIIVDKKEDVYCVTVSTGLIMIRGINGVTTICGNCAMLEHGTVYLYLNGESRKCFEAGIVKKYEENKYSKVHVRFENNEQDHRDWYITTNYRVLVENNWLDDLQYLCEPTEHHEKRITTKFICDRGISHEFVRHRVFSFAQESTRYCNYSKDKFGNEVTFIKPLWLNMDDMDEYQPCSRLCTFDMLDSCIQIAEEDDRMDDRDHFLTSLFISEYLYFQLLKQGKSPQEARAILPNCLKTELVMTGFESDWNDFFKLRCSKTAHPDAQYLANKLKDLMNEKK